MRITLKIDDEELAQLRQLSRLRRISVGQLATQLLRQGLIAERVPATGFRPFASRGVVVTNDQINGLRDADGH